MWKSLTIFTTRLFYHFGKANQGCHFVDFEIKMGFVWRLLRLESYMIKRINQQFVYTGTGKSKFSVFNFIDIVIFFWGLLHRPFWLYIVLALLNIIFQLLKLFFG